MAAIAALMEAARKWGGYPPQPKLAESGREYHPEFLVDLQNWDQALAGVADDQLVKVWEVARDRWDWSKRAMPPWHLQRAAQEIQAPAPLRLVGAGEFDLWEESRARVAAMSAAEFDGERQAILLAANAKLNGRTDMWCEEDKRRHVAAVLARRYFNELQQA